MRYNSDGMEYLTSALTYSPELVKIMQSLDRSGFEVEAVDWLIRDVCPERKAVTSITEKFNQTMDLVEDRLIKAEPGASDGLTGHPLSNKVHRCFNDVQEELLNHADTAAQMGFRFGLNIGAKYGMAVASSLLANPGKWGNAAATAIRFLTDDAYRLSTVYRTMVEDVGSEEDIREFADTLPTVPVSEATANDIAVDSGVTRWEGELEALINQQGNEEMKTALRGLMKAVWTALDRSANGGAQ